MNRRPSAYSDVLREMAPGLAKVEQALTAGLDTRVELVEAIDRYIFKSGGKRLRPLLMIICAKICGHKNDGDFANLGAVIEYLHSATLLHDDILDGADLRRGNPTANRAWGNAAAVLAGDFLYARAFALLVAEYSPAITSLMCRTAADLVQGEALEIHCRRNADLAAEHYFEVIRLKTASLIKASCAAGALLAQTDAVRVDALSRFGDALGMAFQIMDDTLDYIGRQTTFGKTPGGDLREGTVTLPLIHLWKHGGEDVKKRLSELLSLPKLSAEEVNEAVGMVVASGAAEACRAEARRHINEAERHLSLFPEGPEKRMLSAAADYAMSRQV